MMTPAQSLTAIRDKIEEALKATDPTDCRVILAGAHTLALLGAHYANRAVTEEADAKALIDDAIQYEAKVKRRFRTIEGNQRAFQAIVADCILWFDGFRAAHAPKESWERPHVPDRAILCDLNAALQALEASQPEFEEVAF